MDLRKLKIGVLGGGVSGEREISLRSSTMVYSSLRRLGAEAVFIDIYSTHHETIRKELISSNIDLAFVALHGAFGEDGRIQEILEDLGILYTGSGPKANQSAMNKALAKKIFGKFGIPTPGFFLWSDPNRLPEIINYPLVVKPNSSGSSLGISLVREVKELKPALDLAFSHQGSLLIENYIQGREFTVGILGEAPLAVVEIIPKTAYFDFEAKYTQGMSQFIAPAELAAEVYNKIRDYALAAHRSLNLRGFSRVDLILDKNNQVYVLEVNSIPGLTGHSLLPLSSKAEGMDFDSLILRIIELAVFSCDKLESTKLNRGS